MENKKRNVKYLIIGLILLIILLILGYFGYRYMNSKIENKECEKCDVCKNGSAQDSETDVEFLREHSISKILYYSLDSDNKPESSTYIRFDEQTENLMLGRYINGQNSDEGLEDFACVSEDNSSKCLIVYDYIIMRADEDAYVLIFDDSANVYKINLIDYMSIEGNKVYNSTLYSNKKVSKYEEMISCEYPEDDYSNFNCGDAKELRITYSNGTIENLSGVFVED